MRQHRTTRIALGSGILVVLVGAGAILGVTMARRTGVQPVASAHPTATSMAGSHPPAAQSSQGTVVRLHQHVVRLTIHNFAFQPARLVVSPGTRLVWTNTDADPHTVDSTKGVWSSDALDTGSQFVRVFGKAGTFPYYCSIHPFMHGTIVVQK